MGNFDEVVLRCEYFAIYERRKIPCLKMATEMNKAAEFEGSEASMLRILKSMNLNTYDAPKGLFLKVVDLYFMLGQTEVSFL
jgi:hypothetical protein